MRFLIPALLAATLLTADTLPAAAGNKRPAKKATTSVDQIIYDLTIPWPFRRHASGDADHDGVMDSLDRCPGTPTGALVDADGCPADTDGDGVFDGIDKCPDTPRGALVDDRGCAKDSDRDGVPDGIDKCPDTPRGALVDAGGCPKDADGDGVPDGIDRCANTPKGAAVDKHGCPVESSETETELLDTGVIRASNITFASGKADLTGDSHRVLDEIGGILVQWPELEVEIGGHTDSQGSASFNETLSQLRAQSVHDYLTDHFPKIKPENLSVKGYGENVPVASNDTADGRARNRRVEFTVLNKETLKREIQRKGIRRKR